MPFCKFCQSLIGRPDNGRGKFSRNFKGNMDGFNTCFNGGADQFCILKSGLAEQDSNGSHRRRAGTEVKNRHDLLS